jgi:murein DD-endopeptidase MepM/ murein hydrolase activator NlpD
VNRSEVVQTIRQVAAEEGFGDVDLLLATAFQESGFDNAAVGDQGHSVGPFQENDRGRGAGLSAAQRADAAAAARRAIREFAAVRAKHPDVSRGAWAALAQRPADQSGYAANINRMLGGQDRAFSQAVTRAGTTPSTAAAAPRGAAAAGAAGAPISDADAPQWLKDAWAAGSRVGRSGDLVERPGAGSGVTPTPLEPGAPGSTAGFIWPVAGQRPGRVNNPFGGVQSRSAGATVALPSSNVGADLTAAYGADVVAPVSGTVVQVFQAPNETDRNLNSGWGGATLLQGDDGFTYRLSHAKPGSIAARPGQRVQAGQYLQQIGVSGNSTGPHLDLEKFDRPGHFVDPVGTMGRAVSGAAGGVRTAGASVAAAAAPSPISEQEAPDWLKQAWAAGSRVGRDAGSAAGGVASAVGERVGAAAGAAGTAVAQIGEDVAQIGEDVAPDWLKDAWAAGSRVGR